MNLDKKTIDLLSHCARRAYLSTPDAPTTDQAVVLVLFVDAAFALAIVLNTETPQFEGVVRDVFEDGDVEHVLSYRDREAGGLLRVVADTPEGILRFRTSILPGAPS